MKKIILALITSLCFIQSKANNIQVNNVSLNGQNTVTHFSLVNFGVSWENSWRTSTNESNYDGAWIFVKFRKKNAFAWQHATINYGTGGTASASGHTQPSGAEIKTAVDGKGVWMYRNVNGTGNVNFSGAQLRWNYGVDGVADNDSVEVVVYAVEMVYIPQGAFVLGSNGTEASHFRKGSVDTCYPVLSENSITVGTNASDLASSNTASLPNGTIGASYPKGFAAFWIMKYEITQQQYTDFLNCIDASSASVRNPSVATGTHPGLIASQPERAHGYLSIQDVFSFLDWAAMRPISEMEYEKACRGSNQMPIPNEYAWGNTTLTNVATPTNQGMSTETWATGHCNYSNSVAMRSGAVATATSNRQQSGATFYGVMEMSGNIYEASVNAATDGRSFTATHGDGYLNNSATYNVVSWPTSPYGVGHRGGAYDVGSFYSYQLQTSDRSYYYTSININSRGLSYGGRGARTGE